MSVDEALSFTPKDAARVTGTTRNLVFLAMKNGDLRARRIGRRNVILRDDLLAWLQSAPLREAIQKTPANAS